MPMMAPGTGPMAASFSWLLRLSTAGDSDGDGDGVSVTMGLGRGNPRPPTIGDAGQDVGTVGVRDARRQFPARKHYKKIEIER